MATIELLNNVDHLGVKILTERSLELGDNKMFCLSFPAEFRAAQAYYPVLFYKDGQSGQFMPVLLLGFQSGENLFLQQQGWQAGYVPLDILREPFTIGLQQGERVINIDTSHPRVNSASGEPLFLEFGGQTSYLQQVAAQLETLHHGITDAKVFTQQLLALELIESFVLDVTLNNGQQHSLHGFYTINEPRLAQLSGEQLLQLQQAGYLEAIYMMLASQAQFARLIGFKNQLLASN
ncbi:SapC family protein [Alishewanella sp. 16-MA]|uniref:SapC family protein n=1 Tax=Alishewanella maricola TaxID=2795740 RepID=A0ABS8C2J6_9ALTE|nr:SapC family protein [Alishewanella maricola]MCB5226544.1 SapC family protein [Alishewanella maricola]MDP4945352.1 SapC family protein [Alishewanella sp.]MDP5035729.1 SapC family protein [Alishewanella sp.]MDP5186871.1 SapC family protein [Alishewanella sp.]